MLWYVEKVKVIEGFESMGVDSGLLSGWKEAGIPKQGTVCQRRRLETECSFVVVKCLYPP